jgi:transposase-like protein
MTTKTETKAECPECKQKTTHKTGKVRTRKELKQRYRCRACGHTFYNDKENRIS